MIPSSACWPGSCLPLDRTPSAGFLFPGPAGGFVHDVGKQFDAVAKKAKLPVSLVRGRVLRTTYIAHRLQTTDGGQPISLFTVARKAGHSVAVCEGIYARLPEVRHRGPEVGYR